MQTKLHQDARIYRLIRWTILLMTAGLALWIRPAADDFYYMTFTDGDWAQFLEHHLTHYQTMSGRVFVHLVLNPLLILDMWPFRLFFVGLVALFALLTARLCAPEKGRAAAAALALAVFWLQGIEALADGVLWGAGTMNYLFPMTLVVLYAVLLQCFLDGRGGLWLCVPAFLCACTVEMDGFLPIVIFLYLCLTQWEKARSRGWRTALLGLCTLLGYLFLFTSPGVSGRLSKNESGLTLLETILLNYSMIDRRAVGPEGIWAIVMLDLAACGGLLVQGGRRMWAGVFLTGAAFVTLTGVGVIYDGVAVAVIAICAFSLLAGYAVYSFLQGERQLPLWMLCTTLSLGVCLVSPVMGARLIVPTAMMLSIFCVRCMMLLKLPRKWRLGATALIAAAACVLLLDYTVHSMGNARVIDENTRVTRSHEGTADLVLGRVPDEYYCSANVPTNGNFGRHYLRHYGLSDVTIVLRDPVAAEVLWEGGSLGRIALIRGGEYYIPIRTAATVCGAEVRWELASSVVETADGIWCFHKGNWAANLGHGICPSEKLMDPIRAVDGYNYISVRDFRRLFNVELTVIPPEGT